MLHTHAFSSKFLRFLVYKKPSTNQRPLDAAMQWFPEGTFFHVTPLHELRSPPFNFTGQPRLFCQLMAFRHDNYVHETMTFILKIMSFKLQSTVDNDDVCIPLSALIVQLFRVYSSVSGFLDAPTPVTSPAEGGLDARNYWVSYSVPHKLIFLQNQQLSGSRTAINSRKYVLFRWGSYEDSASNSQRRPNAHDPALQS